MIAKQPVESESARQGAARFTLWVEGEVDVQVFDELFKGLVPVRKLGARSGIEGAARAMARPYPEWLFIIDRDLTPDDVVEQQWEKFGKQESNLLMLRRRMIENYFVQPEALEKSEFLTKASAELRVRVLKVFQKRLFLDAANLTIGETRRVLQTNWIDFSGNPDEFPDRQAALQRLGNRSEWSEFRDLADRQTTRSHTEARYHEVVDTLTGTHDGDVLQFGAGRWMELMDGKKALNAVVSECCSQATAIVVRALTRHAPHPELIAVRDLILDRVLSQRDRLQMTP